MDWDQAVAHTLTQVNRLRGRWSARAQAKAAGRGGPVRSEGLAIWRPLTHRPRARAWAWGQWREFTPALAANQAPARSPAPATNETPARIR
jgi:hypothetical protein